MISELEMEMKINQGKIIGRGNCVNTWMTAAIGYKKKCLAEIVGIREKDYGPKVMNELINEANNRVIGVSIYPARGNEIKRFERIKERF